MSFNYQNDAFHSKIYENYKSKLVEQKAQNVSQQQAQNLQKRSKQLEDLKKVYSVQKVELFFDAGEIDRNEYHITFQSKKNGKSYNIRLQLSYDFPQRRPKFYLDNKFLEDYIDPQTLEIKYYDYYPWNTEESTLVELVKNINEMMNIRPVNFGDDYQIIAEQIAFQLKETQKCKELNQITMQNLFPKIDENKRESEYIKLSKNPEIINQQIQSSQEYCKLLQNCKEKSDMVSTLATSIEKEYRNLEEFKKQVNLKQEQFSQKLQEYLYLHGEIQKFQERFEIQAAIAILDCEIYNLEDEINKLMQDRFQNNLNEIAKKFKLLKEEQIYLQLLKQQYMKSN
ncbi:hypothetical protein TTHERM_00565650 (macronuclear) [Tetrahymena thermophila SB210]|uniref:Ubiquitin-conjugating enzyme n=1 Tax=Tetrahymena thermophila (strain SB210) TaxID=312017 RepID=I7M305_TETTS|nr:hypothetical protein TTHERM_00565650 [Tetrahymena thermophila SB210]EAS01820.2 hypothetical protein TTHERM_00565650 [Tetrahymena thermophila SB210]|eukprot:XP_001022065.2 hypothetical protein TTHERM_00565650 [Tetrahymena thermophila SB210]